ncbi:EpsG family protein [Seonamhaeicola sp. NFXS20]|uniref:EpsG family protein n=1 Tax=Seonamhaeicola sp. NFXS20 TaxID=2816959 RepID=UPI003B8BB813
MNSIIPSANYYHVYIYLCLFIVLFTFLHALVLKISDTKNIIYINAVGYFLLFFFIILIGQREITSRYGFGDTANYYKAFKAFSLGEPIKDTRDLGWDIFMKISATIVTAHTFFTICAFLYIYPLYKISKQLFQEYWYYCFFAFIVSFSFYTYGVNGVRNGVAASLFLWGLAYRDNKVIMALFFILGAMFHKTIMLPVLAYLLTYVYNNPKFYLKGWFICIPLSLAMGSFWISLFASLGFDGRLSGYLAGGAGGDAPSFRWDFLFHSFFAVFAGWYFIYKKNFKDDFYNQLLNTYLICNGFWVLVIRANFSNRFAYLSWFMMAIVIFYPLLKQPLFKNHHLMLAKILVAYFSFTFLMYFVYYS